MAEQTFKSPGFFEREIDLSQRETEITGVPAGVAGTAEMGPAFVPVTVGSFSDFEARFGSLDPDKFGPYAVREFLKHRTALTYVRVLGAGANSTTTDFENTEAAGVAVAAGFKIVGAVPAAPSAHGRGEGCVQFIAARHYVSTSMESIGYPIYSNNNSSRISTQGVNETYLVRAMLMPASGTRFEILCHNTASYSTSASVNNDIATVNASDGTFKLVLSSSAGSNFSTTDGFPGIRIYTASLDPVSDSYISKILNTDPSRFQEEQHVLYAHFPIEAEVADVARSTLTQSVALVSGSSLDSSDAGIASLSFVNSYGRFDSRYTTPRSTYFISQPFGTTEYNLFYFETISDGAFANTKFKISIRDVKKSTDPSTLYGTFTVEIRDFNDTDTAAQVYERYPMCSLDPNDDSYVARKIGDFKAYYNFDAEDDSEKKVLVSGKYPNQSSRVRVVMNPSVDLGDVPEEALPFGFRGLPVLKTTDTLTDSFSPLKGQLVASGTTRRLQNDLCRLSEVALTGSTWARVVQAATSSMLPPVPLRFKVTRGAVKKTSVGFLGQPGEDERVDGRFFWGIKFERVPKTGSLSDAIYNTNVSSEKNELLSNYTKFLAIEKLDTLVTGSGADGFNNNKFTLARVAFYQNTGSLPVNLDLQIPSVFTGSAKEHIRDAAYIRNGVVGSSLYDVNDSQGMNGRLTLASLASLTSSVYFNKFADYAKFTNMMYGGFDGLNILNPSMAKMNDKASSSDTGGYAEGGTLDIGLRDNSFGSGKDNSIVASYRAAGRILTNIVTSRVNIIMIPGIRDSALTDYIMDLLPSYGKAFYVVDTPPYDSDSVRLFDESSGKPSVGKTIEQFDSRALDSNYSAAYFPDVLIEDPYNNRPVSVPSSVAVMGALAYNDSVAYPWFAPAGFNRAALDFVSNTDVRLNQGDRDSLYDSRINPIANFPNAGFVIFGQKTLQLARSALDRVNVRRMMLEVKRVVADVANKIVFEQNTPQTRSKFISLVTPLLSNIQIQQGIDQFKVVMDSTNNSDIDIENNVLNGRIVLVPTRAVEFIAMDFIITNSGVSFE